jgi:hypothetical protein
MSNLIPRSTNALASSNIPDTFNKTEGRELSKRQNAEVARGLIAGTRVQAAGFVAGMALQATAMLSREAAFLAGGDERTAARLEHIVDGYAMYAANEVARFQY